MQKSIRSDFPEIEEIRNDLDSLKNNVVELSRHLKSEGRVQASRLSDLAIDRIAELRKSAANEYHRAETRVKEKPGQSIAIAFAAGILASAVLNRRH
ncbi:MAG: hypothetical protein H6865_04445 [Rhodospirillales bacterium]|nr:hypothetical protein [Alphaproteobacteria bacterium]MCB9986868.1 hypothetical protein [Rhodospirillales bacterium]USO08371.1 MAG: hypothetical protein H6866_03935 [Rhodospirillales bacterium]